MGGLRGPVLGRDSSPAWMALVDPPVCLDFIVIIINPLVTLIGLTLPDSSGVSGQGCPSHRYIIRI